MFALFRRKRAAPRVRTPPDEPATPALLTPVPAAELLATPRRRRLLEHIWQRTSLSRAQFNTLYRAPLERYAELVQQFPASENHHHAYLGGMLDHGLEVVAYALKLRQSHLLPVGAPPETQAAQAEAWTACTAYAALLHDVGKIAVDLHVEYANGERWQPWHGKPARPYRFRYRKDRVYRLHGAATGLLYIQVLDDPILDWLSGFPELWASLLYVLAGQYEHAGMLGELVVQADKASVAQDLGGDPAKVQHAPVQALQRKLLEGLRYLVKEELRLNQPQASDGWLTQDSLWLVSKTVCDKLRAHLLSNGVDGVPNSNTAVFNVLQDHGIVQPTSEGKAIWQATVTSESGWTQTFTFLKVSPALIWDASERPASFSGTVRTEDKSGTTQATDADSTAPPSSEGPVWIPSARAPDRTTLTTAGDPIANVLSLLDSDTSPAHSDTLPIAAPGATPLQPSATVVSDSSDSATHPEPAMAFIAWLRTRIQMRHLVINDSKALVHSVDGTAFLVSPGIFHRYAQEHPEIARAAKQDGVADWAWVQKRFEKLRLHRKQPNGLNIWTCEVTGPRKTRRLHGYLLADNHALFAETPPDNPYLKLLTKKGALNTDAA